MNLAPVGSVGPRTGSLEPSGRRPGRPPSLGFCTVCGTRVPRSQGVRSVLGVFLCSDCAKDARSTSPSTERLAPRPRPTTERTGRKTRRPSAGAPASPALGVEEGMVRKNLTITANEDEFLVRHQEINQSALFRQAISALMSAEQDASRRPRKRAPQSPP